MSQLNSAIIKLARKHTPPGMIAIVYPDNNGILKVKYKTITT